jgi:uncharacterized protein (TIGR02001 family)
MRKILSLTTIGLFTLGGAAAHAAPPDTSAMPQTVLPQATPPEAPMAGPVYSFSLTAATDYVFRGVSQTENGGAIFGAGRVSYDNFYLGVGAENVDFHTSTKAEYDLSLGWTPKLDGFRFDFGAVRYGYIDQPAHTYIDTVEFKAVALHDFGPLTLGAAIYVSPNYFGTHRDDVYVQGGASYRITRKITLGGAVGRQSDGLQDHTTWNVGGTYAFTKHLALDLRYADTDEHDLGNIYGSHFTAAMKASF